MHADTGGGGLLPCQVDKRYCTDGISEDPYPEIVIGVATGGVGLARLGVKGGALLAAKLLGDDAAEALATTAARATASAAGRRLAGNMAAAGIKRPTNTAAHHIVAISDVRAATSRGILESFGIDVNDAANGVFLTKNTKVANSLGTAVHSTLHTEAYYTKVEALLVTARSRSDALTILQAVGKRLKSDTFETYKKALFVKSG